MEYVGFDLGFTNPVRTGEVLNVCLCLGCSGVIILGITLDSNIHGS